MIAMTELKEVFADVLDMDAAELRDDAALEELPEWDSVNAVRLMVHLESALGIRLPVERVMSARTLRDIAEAAGENVG